MGAHVLDFLNKWRAWVILGALALALALTPRVPERWGDTLAWGLPIATGVCAIATGSWVETGIRLAAMEAVVQGSKAGLGEAEINARPRGDYRGFPSAHSAHAAFGASTLVQSCAAGSPVVQGALVLAAGFTGMSRVDAGAHNPWQVLVGWLAGLVFARAFPGRIARLLGRRGS